MAEVKQLQLPPHSIEAEQALLGALMIEPRAWARIGSLVGARDIYRADHRVIFDAIDELQRDGSVADSVSVIDHLNRGGTLDKAGGAQYIAQVVHDTPSAANIETYARIVRDRATMRRLVEVSDGIRRSVYEPGERGAEDLVAQASGELLRLQQGARPGSGLVEARKLIGDLIDDLDRRKDGARGISTGLVDFDQLSSGLEPGDLVVIAGRPGMAKTTLLVSVAAQVSTKTGVAIFSAEMSSQQMLRRAVALLGNIDQGKLRRASELTDDDWRAIGEATTKIAERNLHIDDTPSPTLVHLRAETLALKARTSLGLVMVDYVQLVQGKGANRYEQLRDVAYGLKGLAKEANVPIILLAQLNRSVETRGNDKRPRLADLRDSGAIEEAADIVGMLYCESYYNPDFPMPGVLECGIEKNRNGERGQCLWYFSGEHSRVACLSHEARSEYRRLRYQPGGRDDF